MKKDIQDKCLTDIEHHIKYGVSLNPFSTHRASTSWENGFNGKPESLLDWRDEYMRGKTTREILSNTQSKD